MEGEKKVFEKKLNDELQIRLKEKNSYKNDLKKKLKDI
jgi:hypothetical protein